MKNQFVFRDYNDFIIVYSDLGNQYLKLEDVYADFFRNKYICNLSEEETVEKMASEYDAPVDLIDEDFKVFCQQFNSLISSSSSISNQGFGVEDTSFSPIFNEMAARQIPFSATIEITDACNLKCIHCYRGVPQDSSWTIDRFSDVVNQLKELGTMNITLTGGEPFCNPNLKKYLEILNDLHFVINLQTNATLIDHSLVEVLKQSCISDISISLYAVSDDIHDGITGVPGSCEKTKQTIRYLVSENIRVSVNCPIMVNNCHSMGEVKDFCSNLGIAAKFALKIIPSQIEDKFTEKLNVFSTDFIQQCINDPKIKLYSRELPEIRKTQAGDRYCQTGFRSITFDTQGEMLICNAYRKKCGNLLNHTVEELWKHSENLNMWRNRYSFINNKCKNCKAYPYCEPCPAHQYTLTGEEDAIDQITCDFGMAFYSADHCNIKN